ncbi:hypothetical protein [Otoolea muris]|uniref:hypothetical protein n=1 Tax=Otoolea muris TaxID=2941515 RepID=UPI00203F72CE|nr:hypothetical protein [Otoolea muris]
MAGKKKTPEADQAVTGKVENKFSKEQLIASNRFRERRDILEALLATGELYTVKAVEEKITSYMKGKVK